MNKTQFSLSQCLENNRNIFFDKKKKEKYYINEFIIYDLNCYIIELITDWPRLYINTTIYKKIRIFKNLKKYFNDG